MPRPEQTQQFGRDSWLAGVEFETLWRSPISLEEKAAIHLEYLILEQKLVKTTQAAIAKGYLK